MTMRMTVRTLAAAAFLAALHIVPVAHAQSADVLIQQGLELRRAQRDAEALQRFQDAYNLNHSPHALAQIALAEQALGSYVEAEIHLQQALAVQGDAWIDTRRAALAQGLAQISAQLGTIEISGGVAGAQVFVNGTDRGTFPQAARLRVRAGSAVVEIRAQGYMPVQRSIQVSAGGTAREAVQMITAQGQVAVQGQGQVQGQVVQPQGGGGAYVVQQPGQYATYQGQQQPQVQYESQPNLGLFWAGLPVFLVPWILTFSITFALDGGTTDATTWGFIPLIGPWVLLDYPEDDFTFTMLIVSGLLQLAGVTLMVLGLATTREVAVRAELGDGPRAPVLTFTPMFGTDFAGGGLTLTHF